jgi:dTDP-4-amino-4,6-dideoxygalactose transaminase
LLWNKPITNDDALAHKIRGIVNHGMYERYHHDVVGVNSRLDSIQAAVLNAKLPLLDQYGRARQDASRKYSAAFEGHNKLGICDCHVFHQYTLRIVDGDRDGLMKYLQQRYSMCYLLSNSIAHKSLFRCKIQRRRLQ